MNGDLVLPCYVKFLCKRGGCCSFFRLGGGLGGVKHTECVILSTFLFSWLTRGRGDFIIHEYVFGVCGKVERFGVCCVQGGHACREFTARVCVFMSHPMMGDDGEP
mmetsp:Transcript_38939/g.45353  ORF Transcript_38939/g.45353 Transcript_38939/m.45353 type:complete len:106 (-) Transcript_38939:130-447(-)